jgi:hypothetical protein
MYNHESYRGTRTGHLDVAAMLNGDASPRLNYQIGHVMESQVEDEGMLIGQE